MSLKLDATRKTFKLTDESGYGFIIDAVCEDPEHGWDASVKVTVTRGHRDCDSAVMALRYPIEHLLRMLHDAVEK